MKKLFSILMAVCMLASICTLSAGAATVSETSVYTGIPNAETKTFKDGNLQLDVVAGENTVVTNVDDGIKIVNKEDASNAVRLKIAYPSDKKSGSLNISFTFKLIGNEDGVADNIVPSNFGMYTYQKDMETELHGSIWYLDSQGKWRAGSNNRAKDDTEYTMNYTIDLSSGEYTTKRGSTAVTDGAGTADITGGFGGITISLATPEIAGNGIFFKNISVTENSDKYSDYSYLINGVPSIGSTYNGVTVTSTTKGTGEIAEENGELVIKNTTDGKVVTLDFAKKYTYPDAVGKTVYVELLYSTDKALTSNSRIHMRVKTDAETSSGGSYIPNAVFEEEAGTKHRIGFWVDLSNASNMRHYKYIDDAVIDEGGKKVTGTQVTNIFLEYHDVGGANLTIHSVKFMELEPYNYVVEENKYYDKSVMLLNGIPYQGNKASWTKNGIVFNSSLNGDATYEKLANGSGITYSGTDNISEEGVPGDYARLSLEADITKDTFPEGYIYIMWDFELTGSDGQDVRVTGRNDGAWPINHKNLLNPGNHKIEFVYNPQTDEYTYYIDGAFVRNEKNSKIGLPEIMLEYKAVAKTDTLTLKNVRVMHLADEGEDTVGDVVISTENKSASININIEKEFGNMDGKYRFIIVSYGDDTTIDSIKVKTFTAVKGDNKFEIALDNMTEGAPFKAFLMRGNEIIKTATSQN